MKWTNEPPTEPGYYWFSSEPGTKRIFLVFDNLGILTVFDFTNHPPSVSQLHGRWAGPIPEPEE